jgi:release factor glutamine methyltransferase
MAMQDISISIGEPVQVEDTVVYGETIDPQVRVQEEEDETYSFGVPKIKVLRKFQNWCVLQLSRGTETRTLLQWISNNGSDCFDFPELVYSSDSEMDEGEDEPSLKRERTRVIDPVLANPHYSAYAQSLVLVARKPCFLKLLVDLRITVHCLVKGYHRPNSELQCRSSIGGKECRTKATCLEVVPSTTAGYISLLAAHNEQKKSPWIAPRQFRRHLQAGGWPILGNAKEAYTFRGEPLCLSTVRLEFLALGIETKQCVCIPPASKLRALLEREERFWREKRGQEELRVELFGNDIPKPPEYVSERANFDGLEFRVTPAVMIPRQGSEALVQLAVAFYDKQDIYAPRPVVLDLGIGCGSLLISVLHRLRHRNAIGVGIDVSKEALELAEYNIAALGLKQSAKTVRGPFAKIHALLHEPFNVVVCNPPYHTRGGRNIFDAATVTYEPDRALFVDASNALVHYRDVLNGLIEGKLVTRGAFLVFEVFRDNVEAVAKLMAKAGIQNIQVGTDSLDCIRTIEGTFPGVLQRDF